MNVRDWMYMPRRLPGFEKGVIKFLNASFAKASREGQIVCPCKQCKNRYWYHRDEVFDHLKGQGFVDNYYVWIFHGEVPSQITSNVGIDDNEGHMQDNFDELLHDRFRDNLEEPSAVREGVNEEAKTFYRLVEDGKQELFPGSFQRDDTRGKTSEAKKIIRDLGLDYKKISACPNNCMLYWKEHEHDDSCHKCHTSRWKLMKKKQGRKCNNGHTKKIPKISAKVMWHFPLKPRLQRLFMCSDSAKYMTWHDEGRPKDGNLRHPADGQSWKDFDSLYPNFSKEPRNVRLGLSSDGFNPFRTMSISHSTWPVVLINYNLPPWMSLKPVYFMLSLLIPGPESPGNDIDVYLQPLIEELKELWVDGIDTYDKSKDETFKMYAALTWTISDFPGYSMLPGWKTKGKFACPCCNHETNSLYLKHSRKTCYMDHRRFLDAKHPWRHNKSAFNGKVEKRLPPKPLSGVEAFRELSSFQNVFGKTQKKKNDSTCPWKKRSIFFELPYWQFNTCRHNLDVMHIEKNICDNLIGTLLDISGKSKDHAKARFDLLELGIKEKLQPKLSNDGKHVVLEKACFSMSSNEKDIFCRALKEAKLPYGCASNIARCIRSSERKVSGYKSHDAHILLHYLLQVAVRKSLPKHVAILLIRLGSFFRSLCSKVIKPEDLDRMQFEITETLCGLEKIFLPTFFDIMVHLPIHLVNEVRLGGPVQNRWMYFMERYLCKLKSYVRNKSRPEGSIAEGYLIEECLTFCSRYMHEGVKTRLNMGKKDGNSFVDENKSGGPIFVNLGHPVGGKKRRKGKPFTLDILSREQAHRYALFNSDCADVDEYINEHQVYTDSLPRKSRCTRAQNHSHEFSNWLEEKAIRDSVPDHIFWLAKGPSLMGRRYHGYFVNGYRFHTKSRDAKCTTQNSGVSLTASTPSFASSRDKNPVIGDVDYYGRILDIIELDYWSKFQVVLFRCEWYQVEKDEYGLTCVNFNKFCSSDDPFVMPSQVNQVFYVPDPIEDNLHYVVIRVPRDLYDFDKEGGENVDDSYWCEANEDGSATVAEVGENETPLIRKDMHPLVVDASTSLAELETCNNLSDDSDYDDTIWDWMQADEDDTNNVC